MTKVVVHHTLHGYSDGHRLLESSRPLSQEAAQLLLVLSDISGPSSGYEFGSYLTGYPLEKGLYALAKTWRAAELPRPGCVWTHTLLLETDVIRRLQDPGVVLECFRRPTLPPSEHFQEPLKIDADRLFGGGPLKLRLDRDTVKRVLAELYANRNATVIVLLAEGPADYEDLILAIWMQQWAELRETFTFCSLALERRTLRGIPLALQLMPRRLTGLKRASPEEALVDLESAAEGSLAEPWLEVVTQDLLSPKENGSLRWFLREYAQDVSASRWAFKGLCQLYAALDPVAQEESMWPELVHSRGLVQLVGESFGRCDEAARLKLRLFGPAIDRWRPFEETDILLELARTEYYQAFDVGVLRIRERARILAERIREAGKRIVLTLIPARKLTPLGRECLLGVIEGLDDDSRRSVITPDVVTLLPESPEIAASPHIWSAATDDLRPELWKTVVATGFQDDAFRSRVVNAVLDADADTLAEEVVKELGAEAVRIIMAWVERKGSFLPGKRLSRLWIRAMRTRRTDLVSWLVEHPAANAESLSVIGASLRADDVEIRKIATGVWVEAARRAAQLLPCPVPFMALVLAVGFRTPGREGAELVAYAFERVHDAAWDQALGDEAWSLLEGDLPWVWEEWDRCKRLRRGLVDHFLKRSWPTEYLLKAVTRERTLELALAYCTRSFNGRRLIRDLAEQVERLETTDAQKTVVRRFARSPFGS